VSVSNNRPKCNKASVLHCVADMNLCPVSLASNLVISTNTLECVSEFVILAVCWQWRI